MKILLPLCSILAGAALLSGAPTAGSLGEAFTLGQPDINLRLRCEDVQQTGLVGATAFTLRTRLGFTTAPLAGWQAMLEAENVAALDPDAYSQAGLNPGGAGRAVVADPTGTDIDQAWLGFTADETTVILGRQRLVLDNARFVGDSAWRQHLQTFDGLVLRDRSLDHTTLTYAYLDRINRVFGDRSPQGYWPSTSHLLNASYAGLTAGTLTGYGYLLDFRGAGAASSCATYGASFNGEQKLPDGWKFTYRAEVATQTDYGSSPLNYSARYQLAEAGLGAAPGGLALGCEVLGSGHGVGFKTPLATLHAFDGWADLFLTTPAAGLRDTYVKGTASLPAGISLQACQHWFAADRAGPDPGCEFDAQLGRKFGPHVTALLKYADFRRATTAYPNVQKFWAQVEFAL
jgi:hypothetical protein